MSRSYELLQRAAEDQTWKSVAGPVVETTDNIPVPVESPSVPRQELSKLVHRLFLFNQQAKPKVVVFTGIGRGSGCSSICAGAGEALSAQVAGPVCIVDANLRIPRLHQYFRVDNLKGLTDAVLGAGPIHDYVQRLPGKNTWFLSSGSVSSPLSALMRDNKLASRFAELRTEFQYVLIDSPSANDFTDPILIGQLADGVVLVVESRSTRREVARRVKETIEAAKVPVVGAVLNRREFPIPPFIYERL
ncbi:MAG: CpsD/CapB family tyrosine-protein kinase [Terriglobia bacterium]